MATENVSNRSSVIIRGKKNQYPDMVQISEAQVIEMQLTALKNWKPQSQMYFTVFINGFLILLQIKTLQ